MGPTVSGTVSDLLWIHSEWTTHCEWHSEWIDENPTHCATHSKWKGSTHLL